VHGLQPPRECLPHLQIPRAQIITALLASLVHAALVAQGPNPSTTLARIRAANVLHCGVDIEEAEYSTSDDHGNRAAFDADLCRAVAVAVLGSKAQIAITNYPDDAAAMSALQAGQVDLIPTLTDDFTHQAGTHLTFTRPVLWDGVGFLTLAATPTTHARDLTGKKICFLAETTVEESLRAWFAREHLDFVPFPFQEEGEMQAAFATSNCGALAGDRTRLAQTRAAMATHAKPTHLLPETISNDPLAAAIRDNDQQWFSIVNWVMESLIQAEESGVTQANAHQLAAHAADDNDPQRRFMLGGSHQIGAALGLDNDWAARVIEATGNYGEIYDRDLGVKSPMNLPRGENKLSSNGGLMIALPPK
jgi:general L-amino acid transport system substrate-binding protein